MHEKLRLETGYSLIQAHLKARSRIQKDLKTVGLYSEQLLGIGENCQDIFPRKVHDVCLGSLVTC